MKRPSYRYAIAWIAGNDEPGNEDALRPEVVREMLTVALVADLFGVTDVKVGQDVVAYRFAHGWSAALAP
jgi:hypothetical protein